MPDRTLYVTDLDGTLLGSDARLSARASTILARLIDHGALITCATARSWSTTQKVLGAFRFRLPVAVYDGTFIYDAAANTLLDHHHLEESTAAMILDACRALAIPPLVFWTDGTREAVSWVRTDVSDGIARFWQDRPTDERNTPVEAWANLPTCNVFHVAAIGTADTSPALAAHIQTLTAGACEVNLQYDTYHPDEAWIDIAPTGVSKALAVRKLVDLVGATRLVVFGDNLNDLSMFAAADQSYAVANAHAEVLSAATGIIGSNDDDAVPRWLDARWRSHIDSR